MQLGYSITSAVPGSMTASEAATAVLERGRVAVDAGFDYIQTGDHHAVGGNGYLQNIPMTARLTEVADYVAPLFLLPLWNPVLVAEQVGTINALSSVDVWFTLGRADQTEVMGIPAAERVGRMEEAISLITQLWTEDNVTYTGDYYAIEDVSVSPKADPRIVIGGTAEPAVRRAGRLGDAWVANANVPVADIADRVEWFEETGGGDVLARRDALVLADSEQAESLATELLENGYRGWPADAEWILAGDATDVAAQLETLQEAGVDEVVVRPMADAYAEETLREVARSRDVL